MNDFETKLKMIDKLVSSNKELEEWTNKYLSIVDEEENLSKKVAEKAVTLVSSLVGEQVRINEIDLSKEKEMRAEFENRLTTLGMAFSYDFYKFWHSNHCCEGLNRMVRFSTKIYLNNKEYIEPYFWFHLNEIDGVWRASVSNVFSTFGIVDGCLYSGLHKEKQTEFATINNAKEATEQLLDNIAKSQKALSYFDLIADKVLERVSH